MDWELSQSFVSDGQGVRAAGVLPAKAESGDAFVIVAGNQGGGLCEFGVPSASIYPIEYQHNHAVTALLSNESVYITGCKDAMIRVFSRSHELMFTLIGHDKPVTSLAWVGSSYPQYFISGSWDGTAKIWNLETKSLVTTLGSHENSVSVFGGLTSIDDETIIVATGSAGMAQNNTISGHTVRLWQVNLRTAVSTIVHKVANDHDGPIRDLALVGGGNYLATCSNDGTVKLRSPQTGECISTLTLANQSSSHPPIVLSVTALGESMVAASTEDGQVIIWHLKGEVEPQKILHPSCVWNVVALPNGDLATCCQDGSLRIFSQSQDRIAPAQDRVTFQELVQESLQKQQTGPSADEIAKLPKWENSSLKLGTSDGQVQVFNKAGVAIAAQWSMTSQTWIEVGQVVGSHDGGVVDGVQYDHTWPIEVDLPNGGGVGQMQLGYNNGENPFVAAQRFIDAHVLPQYHLTQIADYIQQRLGNSSGGPTLGAATSTPSAATTGVPLAGYLFIPMRGYKSFELPEKSALATLEKMKSKLESGGLPEAQVALIASLITKLAATNRYHATTIENTELSLLLSLLDTLPPSDVFPVLDLARLTVLHPDAASKGRAEMWNQILQSTFYVLGKQAELQGTSAVAVPMLSLRLFANCFKGGSGSTEAIVVHIGSVLEATETLVLSSNKNIRLSVATVLLNVTSYYHANEGKGAESSAYYIVSMLTSIIESKSYDEESLFRSLVALGTLILCSEVGKDAAKSMFLASKVEPAASPFGSKVKAVAKEVYSLLG